MRTSLLLASLLVSSITTTIVHALAPRPLLIHTWGISRVVPRVAPHTYPFVTTTTTALFSSSPFQTIHKPQMEEIIQDLEEMTSDGSRSCDYVVLDVRNPEEIRETGPLSASVQNLPLSRIVEDNVLELDDADFEEACGFPKPAASDTLVFSCKAGKRAEMAATQASQEGYENLVVYSGSANEWFS